MSLVTLRALKAIKTLRMYKISSNYFKILCKSTLRGPCIVIYSYNKTNEIH